MRKQERWKRRRGSPGMERKTSEDALSEAVKPLEGREKKNTSAKDLGAAGVERPCSRWRSSSMLESGAVDLQGDLDAVLQSLS